jgi:hypothetical protein
MDWHVFRAEWRAAPVVRAREKLRAPAQLGLVVHHTGEVSDLRENHAECYERVRSTQRFHQQKRGWSDIAYNWLICHHGALFQGRGVGIRSAAQGTDEGNARWHAAAFLGHGKDFQSEGLAAEALLRARRHVLEFSPLADRVWPHLLFHPTECPGSRLREWCRQFP